MKKFKYLFLALMAVLSFSACDELEGDSEPTFNTYFNMEVTKAERVGANLKVDFTLKNKSGKDLQNVSLNGGSVWDMMKDDLGNTYYSEISIEGGNWRESTSINIAKGETVSGSFLITNYDATNSSRKLNVIFGCSCATVDFSGRGEVDNVSIVDNRVLKNGICTNDQILTYTLVNCIKVNKNAYITFTVKNTSAKDISEFQLTATKAKDNGGDEYYYTYISMEGGSYATAQTTTLKAGETKTYTYMIRDVRDNATSLNGTLQCLRMSYPWADTSIRFYDIAIQR